MAYSAANLVKGFFDIGGDGKDIARVTKGHLLAQIDTDFVVVRRIERRDFAHALRTEAGAGAVGGPAVKGDAQHGRIIVCDL